MISTISVPVTNIELIIGTDEYSITMPFCENKTLINKIKWWICCKVFPFRIKWTD